MFEKAARLKLRFKSSLSVEDLWDLSPNALDAIFKDLNAQTKVRKEESLLDYRSTEDTIVDLKIDIVKHIVSVKLEEK